ncbi:glycosyltransferase [Azospirillum sp. ST 5-10]|uniref:glycosyltransferase n=1 Tax=unclassified Azospirillum TaxID=2630922 RepID=UPI003F49EAA3
MESVASSHPDSVRFIVLCDRVSPTTSAIDVPATIVPVEDLGLPDVEAMAFVYSVMEFSTAIKPACFQWLMERFDAGGYVYLDPDIVVVAPLVDVRDALSRGAGLVLTPHITRPLQDGRQPDDLTIMKSGIYNLGFMAAAKTPETLLFLGWWADRCRRDAVVDVAANKFTDQRWVDLAPAFVASTAIIHDPGYNIAYWNLSHRPVTDRSGTYLVNDRPVRFVHFSGVVPSNTGVFSKHQDRYASPDDIGPLRTLFLDYVARLHRNGWEATTGIPYAFGFFGNGRTIHPFMRRVFRRAEQNGLPAALRQPFTQGGRHFDEAAPETDGPGGQPITRLMHELWLARDDLRRTFAIDTAAGRTDYLAWFVDGGGGEAGFDAESVAAARRLMQTAKPSAPVVAPWPRQGRGCMIAPTTGLARWLGTAVPINVPTGGGGVHVPRWFALLWEQRDDLQRSFPNQTEQDLYAFLTWCLTEGVRQGCVDLGVTHGTLGPFLDSVEDDFGGDVPLTRLMRMMAPLYPFPDQIEDFPRCRHARLRLALWLCGTMGEDCRWPDRFTRRLRDWLFAARPERTGDAPLDNLLLGVWQLRPDLQRAFDVDRPTGRRRLLQWFIHNGLREIGLGPAMIAPWLKAFLRQEASPTLAAGLCNLHRLLWSSRADLMASFPYDTPAGAEAMVAWLADLPAEEEHLRIWADLLERPPATVRCSPPAPLPDILLTGYLASPSGRGEDVRMTARTLQAAGIPFASLDRASGRLVTGDGREVAVDGHTARINVVHMNADTALMDHAFLRRARINGEYRIGYWAWELARFPADWLAAFSFYDEIWASTRFAYNAFKERSPRPVHLLPLAVEVPAVDETLTRRHFGVPDDTFLFYFGFDYLSFAARKNPDAAIAAFRRAFPNGDEPVTLLVKSINAAHAPDRANALRLLAGRDPRIVLRDEEYNYRELMSLVALSDAYVSLHRSEGFGRGPAEAMMLGKPVVVTGYSGNLDFTTTKTALLAKYKLVPVRPGDYPGHHDQMWAEVDVRHAATLMRKLVEDRAFCHRIAAAAQRFMRRTYAPAALSPLYAERIRHILKMMDDHDAPPLNVQLEGVL